MRIDLVSELRTPAIAALDALATTTLARRDDITAAIQVIESEAERLGDHGLEALGEQLRVIALRDSPRPDDTTRPVLGLLAAQLRTTASDQRPASKPRGGACR